MDTKTLLEIIKMIEDVHKDLYHHLVDEDTNASEDYLKGGMHQLFYLKEHLESLIERQSSASENISPE